MELDFDLSLGYQSIMLPCFFVEAGRTGRTRRARLSDWWLTARLLLLEAMEGGRLSIGSPLSKISTRFFISCATLLISFPLYYAKKTKLLISAKDFS
jgi:hypothetical protein